MALVHIKKWHVDCLLLHCSDPGISSRTAWEKATCLWTAKCCKSLTSAKNLHTDVVLPKRMPLLGGLQEWWDHVYCCPEHRAIHVCHTIFPSSVDLHSWQSWAEDDLTRWGCAAYGLWTTSCAQHARIGRWHFAGQAVGLATMLQPQNSISPCLILPLVYFQHCAIVIGPSQGQQRCDTTWPCSWGDNLFLPNLLEAAGIGKLRIFGNGQSRVG
jgi:hypothetical protein